MFRNSIRTTPLTNDAANDFFSEIIDGNSYLGDYTFVSTLRGIVYHRMSEGESIMLQITSSNEKKSTIERYTDRECKTVADFYPDSWGDEKHTNIGLHVFDSPNDEDNDAWLDYVAEKMIEGYPSWERLPRVTDFFRKITGFRCVCICDKEHHNVMLYVKNLTMQRYHYMQCGILAYLPWYFNKEDGISPEEMEMIEGLRVKDPENYLASCAKFAAKLDLDTARIKKMLKGIETSLDRSTLESVKSTIERHRNNIIQYRDSIADLLDKISKLEIQYEGLQVKIASGEEGSGIMDFFLSHKNVLHLRNVSGNSIYLQVTAYCDFFDEDIAERTISNKNSYIYRETRAYIPEEDIEKLMRAVFIDRTIRLRFCAEYQIDLNREVHAKSGAVFIDTFKDTYMPNPHINRYSCIGNYERIMTDYLSRGDNIGAITQCIASCSSLNFSDATVMEYFMRVICGRHNDINSKAFELPDGTVVTPKEAIAWLKGEEKEA